MILHTAGWFDDAKSYVERFVETFRPDSGANMLLGPVLGPIYNALIEGTASNPAAVEKYRDATNPRIRSSLVSTPSLSKRAASPPTSVS